MTREAEETASPTSNRRAFLEARWGDLALLNYACAPSLLEPYVPRGTELDLWQGEPFVSVVGLMFLDTRVRGVTVPLHGTFEEVNLRFYVRRRGPEGWRRAVVFIQEYVPLPLITLGARLFYNEAYDTAPMTFTKGPAPDLGPAGRSLTYTFGRPPDESVIDLAWTEPLAAMAPDSHEAFIAEHYWGYSTQRDGGTVEYRVEHDPWLVAPALRASLRCDVSSVYGEAFVDTLCGAPTSAFYAAGAPVTIYPGTRLDA